MRGGGGERPEAELEAGAQPGERVQSEANGGEGLREPKRRAGPAPTSTLTRSNPLLGLCACRPGPGTGWSPSRGPACCPGFVGAESSLAISCSPPPPPPTPGRAAQAVTLDTRAPNKLLGRPGL